MSYEFAQFRLSVALRELARDGEALDVQRRVLDLLIYLIENRTRTVSKDEIQDAVWPGTVVTEAALTRAVMKARRALGDDGSEQQFIKTVHGQGYRFVAPVTAVGDSDEDSLDGESEAVRTERRQAVLRVATTYGAGAWLLNQAAAMVWEAFEWDRWPQQLLLAVSLVGFPLVVGFTWFYRATATGIALRSESRARAMSAPASHRVRDRWVIGMLATALVLSVSWNLRDRLQTPQLIDRIAVLPIHNATADPELEWISLGMMSLVASQLSSAEMPVVLPQQVLGVAPEPTVVELPLIERLRRAHAARYVVDLTVERSGAEYKATGRLFDEGELRELPDAAGDSPSGAVRAWTQQLMRALLPGQGGQDVEFRTGDLFVDQAYARGMHELLSGNVERARDLLEVAANAQPDAFEPRYELNIVTRRLGDLPAARSGNLELLTDLRNTLEVHDLDTEQGRGAARKIGFVANELGIIADLQGRLDEAAEHYDEGLHWSEAVEEHERRAVLLINYAILERARGNPGRQRELLGLARTAYTDAGVELLPGDFFITLGNTDADNGDVESAREQYRQALANFREMERVRGEGIALSNLSWASQQLGDIPAAFGYLEQSEALRARVGDRVGVVKSKIRRADLYFETGRFDEALIVVAEIVDDPYAVQEDQILATALNIKGEIARIGGRYEEAQQNLQDSLELERAGGRAHGALRATLALARVHLDRQRFESAERLVDEVLVATADGTLPIFRAEALVLRGRLLDAQGGGDTAIAVLKDGAEAARVRGNLPLLTKAAGALVEVYFRTADLEGAETWAGVAVDADPRDPVALIAQAKLALMKNDFVRAKQYTGTARANSGQRYLRELDRLDGLLAER